MPEGIGYEWDTNSLRILETARHPELIGNPNVNVFPLTPVPEWIAWNNLPFFINIPCKVLQQFYTLYCTLMYNAPAAKWMVLQVRHTHVN